LQRGSSHRVPVPGWFPIARIENANHEPFGALHIDVHPQMLTGECGQARRTSMDDAALLWMMIMPVVIAIPAFGWAALSMLI
jgi:hypothetical protein